MNEQARTDRRLPAPAAPLTKEALQPFLVRRDGIAALYCGIVVLAVLATIAACDAIDSAWIIALAILILGALQHHLSIIHHESVHYLLFRRRWLNELVGRFLGAYTVGFTMAYRRTHLAHHRRLGTADDPDLHNFAPFPSGPWPFLCNLLKNVTGLAALRQFIDMTFGRSQQPKHRRDRRLAGFGETVGLVVTQTIILSGFFTIGHADWYVILWLLPLVTVAKTLANLRNLAEHIDTSNSSGAIPRWRTIYCHPLEGFFFAPANFNYHAEHHLYPAVPFYHLPALHRRLIQNVKYKAQIDIRQGFLGFLLGEVCFGCQPKPLLLGT